MTFQQVINQKKPVLVDFFATWCGPCQMMEPILGQVKNNLGDRADIIKIDVDQNPQAAAAFQVRGVPTLILFKNGKPVWRQAGLVSAAQIEKIITENS